MMSNKLVPFSIPILSKQLSKESFKVIKNEVISFISNNPELFKLAWDCSTKSTVQTKPPLNFKSNTLSKELKDLAIEYCDVFNFGELYLNGDEIWVNIAEQGAHQEAHTHTNFFSNIVFSGVLYIQTLENNYMVDLGQIEYQIQSLKSQKNTINTKLVDFEQRKIKFAQQLQDNYGEGSINIETGEFTKTN